MRCCCKYMFRAGFLWATRRGPPDHQLPLMCDITSLGRAVANNMFPTCTFPSPFVIPEPPLARPPTRACRIKAGNHWPFPGQPVLSAAILVAKHVPGPCKPPNQRHC